MLPQYSTAYVREFLRLLVPGGILVFQLTSEPVPIEQKLPRVPSSSIPRLDDQARRVRITLLEAPRQGLAGDPLTIVARVENVSDQAWPSFLTDDGIGEIKLGNHWLDSKGRTIQNDDARARLPGDLQPGEETILALAVSVPAEPGKYTLQLDMVQEGVAWFESSGLPPTSVPLHATKKRAERTARSGKQAFEPRMEMHGVKREVICQLISEHGAQVVDVVRAHMAGGDWFDYRYVVQK
jgi:hypothetical protein